MQMFGHPKNKMEHNIWWCCIDLKFRMLMKYIRGTWKSLAKSAIRGFWYVRFIYDASIIIRSYLHYITRTLPEETIQRRSIIKQYFCTTKLKSVNLFSLSLDYLVIIFEIWLMIFPPSKLIDPL